MAWNPQHNQPPFPPPSGMPPGTPSPQMAHPPYNPGGTYPGMPAPRNLEIYGERKGQAWVFDAGTSLWRWVFSTPELNLRPGIDTALGPSGGRTTPMSVNHEAALGLNFYLNVLIFTQTSGGTPPAEWPFMRAEYWEEGNPSFSDQLYQLTPPIDVTDLMQAGGSNALGGQGATNFNFSPPPALRYWRLFMRLSIPGTAGSRPATDFSAWLSLH